MCVGIASLMWVLWALASSTHHVKPWRPKDKIRQNLAMMLILDKSAKIKGTDEAYATVPSPGDISQAAGETGPCGRWVQALPLAVRSWFWMKRKADQSSAQ